MSTVIVFLGPSLPVAAARRILDADFWPPVQRGDVLRALYREPSVIAIVDGYFHGARSVWHKEILVALERGVRVYGAASMGALRAAELHRFGMVGVGRVFESYRDGVCEDDDEVSVLHAGEELGYRPLSDAMVDIRDAYGAAASTGTIGQDLLATLLCIAKGLHYTERSHLRILASARALGHPLGPLDNLGDFLRAHGPGLKQRDAAHLLHVIAECGRDGSALTPADLRVERTTYLRALEEEVFADLYPWGRVTGIRLT